MRSHPNNRGCVCQFLLRHLRSDASGILHGTLVLLASPFECKRASLSRPSSSTAYAERLERVCGLLSTTYQTTRVGSQSFDFYPFLAPQELCPGFNLLVVLEETRNKARLLEQLLAVSQIRHDDSSRRTPT